MMLMETHSEKTSFVCMYREDGLFLARGGFPQPGCSRDVASSRI
jgi:hypothetical protein